ncbi:hypothetical protein [Halorubrum ezzemoulense]|uniref:hypothetical protein n=1 Tax=Halorubrum ezzemoulense TaxID=337243 RepID=UPI003743E910
MTSEVGIVGDSSAGELSEIRLTVTGAPGAEDIDLAETTIQAVGPGGQENLVFTSDAGTTFTALDVGSISDGTTGSFDVTIGDINQLEDIDTSGDNQQLVVTVNDDSGGEFTTTLSGSSVVNDGAQTITLDSTAGSNDDTIGLDTLNTDDEITVELYDDSSSTDSEFLVSSVNIVVDGSDTDSDDVSTDLVSALGAGEFAVGENGDFETSPVLNDQNDYTILINPGAGAFNGGTFGEGNEATVDIVSPAGATTQVELRAPDLFSEDGEAVQL